MDLLHPARGAGDDQGIVLKDFEQFFRGWVGGVAVFRHQAYEQFFMVGDVASDVVLDQGRHQNRQHDQKKSVQPNAWVSAAKAGGFGQGF